jgi:hypothetical protein
MCQRSPRQPAGGQPPRSRGGAPATTAIAGRSTCLTRHAPRSTRGAHDDPTTLCAASAPCMPPGAHTGARPTTAWNGQRRQFVAKADRVGRAAGHALASESVIADCGHAQNDETSEQCIMPIAAASSAQGPGAPACTAHLCGLILRPMLPRWLTAEPAPARPQRRPKVLRRAQHGRRYDTLRKASGAAPGKAVHKLLSGPCSVTATKRPLAGRPGAFYPAPGPAERRRMRRRAFSVSARHTRPLHQRQKRLGRLGAGVRPEVPRRRRGGRRWRRLQGSGL